MNVGYACITVGVRGADLKTCTLKYASRETLRRVIEHNLSALGRMIDYNRENGIKLFRISSDLIPLGSHPANDLPWWEIYSGEFTELAEKIKGADIRISMHPGQYTILNSPDEGVVARSIGDLRYHAKVLDCLGAGRENKIILHLGGVYGNREASLDRLHSNFSRLPAEIRDRIALENDERCYDISQVVQTAECLGVPAVLDALHHAVNPATGTAGEWIARCADTWKREDGRQKIHYSQQGQGKPGAHSGTIAVGPFVDFCSTLPKEELDIMLEVKDKNLSAVKCKNALQEKGKITVLENEWARYKYTVLEKGPAAYGQIRQLLKDKNAYPVREFYTLIEGALERDPTGGDAANAALHVWGYLKPQASEGEKKRFFSLLQRFQQGGTSLAAVKNHLDRLTVKYQISYLMDSLYFFL